jgi:hypothetical protein
MPTTRAAVRDAALAPMSFVVTFAFPNTGNLRASQVKAGEYLPKLSTDYLRYVNKVFNRRGFGSDDRNIRMTFLIVS